MTMYRRCAFRLRVYLLGGLVVLALRGRVAKPSMTAVAHARRNCHSCTYLRTRVSPWRPRRFGEGLRGTSRSRDDRYLYRP